MAEANETERLKARVAELEAKQAPSGVGGVLAIVQAVVGLVPRWLVVAVGVLVLAEIGFKMYMNARQTIAATEQTESAAKETAAKAAGAAHRPGAALLGPDKD